MKKATKPLNLFLALALLATTIVIAGASPASADWREELDQPVLLIHGFSPNPYKQHDCEEYWGDLADYLEELDGRTVHMLGYYDKNKNCEQFLAGDQSTDILVIASALRDEILDEFDGQTVDIVAHSMGGLVVRRMLDNWGDQLRVDDVVTLGTPHNGVRPGDNLAIALCPFKQCDQMKMGSSFLNGLEHNPQSAIETNWTLIGTHRDEVVGPFTSVEMTQGSSWKPEVDTYHYDINARHSKQCPKKSHYIGHEDLHRPIITRDCEFGPWGDYGDGTYTDRPFRRVRLAIKY